MVKKKKLYVVVADTRRIGSNRFIKDVPMSIPLSKSKAEEVAIMNKKRLKKKTMAFKSGLRQKNIRVKQLKESDKKFI